MFYSWTPDQVEHLMKLGVIRLTTSTLGKVIFFHCLVYSNESSYGVTKKKQSVSDDLTKENQGIFTLMCTFLNSTVWHLHDPPCWLSLDPYVNL